MNILVNDSVMPRHQLTLKKKYFHSFNRKQRDNWTTEKKQNIARKTCRRFANILWGANRGAKKRYLRSAFLLLFLDSAFLLLFLDLFLLISRLGCFFLSLSHYVVFCKPQCCSLQYLLMFGHINTGKQGTQRNSIEIKFRTLYTTWTEQEMMQI